MQIGPFGEAMSGYPLFCRLLNAECKLPFYRGRRPERSDVPRPVASSGSILITRDHLSKQLAISAPSRRRDRGW